MGSAFVASRVANQRWPYATRRQGLACGLTIGVRDATSPATDTTLGKVLIWNLASIVSTRDTTPNSALTLLRRSTKSNQTRVCCGLAINSFFAVRIRMNLGSRNIGDPPDLCPKALCTSLWGITSTWPWFWWRLTMPVGFKRICSVLFGDRISLELWVSIVTSTVLATIISRTLCTCVSLLIEFVAHLMLLRITSSVTIIVVFRRSKRGILRVCWCRTLIVGIREEHLVDSWIGFSIYHWLIVTFVLFAIATLIEGFCLWLRTVHLSSVGGPALSTVTTILTLLIRALMTTPLHQYIIICALMEVFTGRRHHPPRRSTSRIFNQHWICRVKQLLFVLRWSFQTALDWQLAPVHANAILVILFCVKYLAAQPRVSLLSVSSILSIAFWAIVLVNKVRFIGN